MTSATAAKAEPMVDWDFAVKAGTRLAPKPPKVSREEAAAIVAELRAAAQTAQQHVRDHTGLVAPADDAAVAIIDRPSWIRANAAAFEAVLDPLVDRLAARRKAAPTQTASLVGSALTGAEAGGLLAFMSGKVLGQYEVFGPVGTAGRLLLVAPNIVAAERAMGVDPSDFRLWVCLHEETHRVQFGVAPWLREHLLSELDGFVDDASLDVTAVLKRLWAVVRAVFGALRGKEGQSLVEAVQTPAQREALARVTAVMSLLEGHADVVMDDVGPKVVPSVEDIRRKFQRRREGTGRSDSLVRTLLGLDAKMRQYRDGAVFVRGVIDLVGMDGFNRVWESPETLPLPHEIADPAAWVARVV